MTRLGILAGSSFLGEDLALDAAPETIPTPHGPVPLLVGETFVFLPRHGSGALYRPPHRIPHHAHALALEALGVRRAVGLYSVGGLRPAFVPGTVVIPDDYLSMHPPQTRAEVRFLGQHAHGVGMTGASEATLLQERGIAFGMLAIVDNLAHGVGESPLSMEACEARRRPNGTLARSLFQCVLEAASELAAGGDA